MSRYPPTQPKLTMRIVYEDLPSMVEIETRVEVGEWTGVARAYASPDSIREEARALMAWCNHPDGTMQLVAGADTGIGWAKLRFYTVDWAGHVMCHVQLATQGIDRRAEEIARMSVEMPTEPGLVERFAAHLETIIETVGEEAVLLGVLR